MLTTFKMNDLFVKIPNKDFEMSKYQVTQKLWEYIMGNNPSHFNGEDLPVENVSWNDCQEFIKKLNDKKDGYTYRLPTEAEWEFCAKPCDDQDIKEIAWFYENSENKTHGVGLKIPNKYGVYDMFGNVLEWCEDSRVSDSYRGLRGGSCGFIAQYLRSANRINIDPGFRNANVGLRLVRNSSSPIPSNTITLSEIKTKLLRAHLKRAKREFLKMWKEI